MSTNVQNFHLSKESRYILYRLRSEIDFQLNKDITEGFPCVSRSLGNLLPLIYQAFIKVWCGRGKSLIVKKPSRSVVSLCDRRKILVDYDEFVRLLRDSALYHQSGDVCSSLPF